MVFSKLQQKLIERAENNSLRKLTVSQGLVDFYSNDYLGIAKNKSVYLAAHEECLSLNGNLNGATGSRLLSGNSVYSEQLEKELAILFRGEKALLFNSGYNANLSVLSAIPQKGDTIVYDELIHSSLKDGYRLSFASRFPFRHNSLDDLEQKLKKAKGTVFVVVESVYSMDGDAAPLKEMVELCNRYQANIILDEAHSTGLYGEGGNGLACALGVEQSIFARVYTFGKGMGVHGACVVGNKLLIDYLVNFARPFIYTTALPLHSQASIKQAFECVKNNPTLVVELQNNIVLFRKGLSTKFMEGNRYVESTSPIQVIRIAGNTAVKKLAAVLQQNKLDVRPILSPTVKEGEERIRICLHAYNTSIEIDTLLNVINEAI